MTINNISIHVRLLNEGTDVTRPTKAMELGNGLFKILPTDDYNPEDEEWEFIPGSTVRCQKKNDTSDILMAVSP